MRLNKWNHTSTQKSPAQSQQNKMKKKHNLPELMLSKYVGSKREDHYAIDDDLWINLDVSQRLIRCHCNVYFLENGFLQSGKGQLYLLQKTDTSFVGTYLFLQWMWRSWYDASILHMQTVPPILPHYIWQSHIASATMATVYSTPTFAYRFDSHLHLLLIWWAQERQRTNICPEHYDTPLARTFEKVLDKVPEKLASG